MRRPSSRIAVALSLPSLLAFASWAVQGGPPQDAAPRAARYANAEASAKLREHVLEQVPDRFQARIEQRKRTLAKVPIPAHPGSPTLRAVINLTKRWPNGKTIKVAFKGGNDALRKQIADAVSEWTNHANLKFDFMDPGACEYREWKPSDANFAADVRVSFDQSGYYALVGKDSVDPMISRAGEESLNLEGFDQSLPSDWKGVALHEFGHAIGFEHEHQGPDAMCDFRFDDDPGYVATTDGFGQFIPDHNGKRPGIYTQLGGPPNNWPEAVVDHNLKNLPRSSAFDSTTFDKHSIMKYFFEDYMFVSGKDSPCYTDGENVVISDLDKAGAARFYPRAAAEIAKSDEVRARVLDTLSKAEALPKSLKMQYQKAREAMKK